MAVMAIPTTLSISCVKPGKDPITSQIPNIEHSGTNPTEVLLP